MANSYDQINKIKAKYETDLKSKDSKIKELETQITSLKEQNDTLRKRLYDAGEGKGDNHRLKKELTAKERDNKTLINQIKELDGSKYISSFIPERQQLINNIKNLKFNNSQFFFLWQKFNAGLDDIIQVAYRIKINSIGDLDYFTFAFRDTLVSLLEKMFVVLLGNKESSASKFLVKLASGTYKLPKDYYLRIPKLNEKKVIENILDLVNLESTSYHGAKTKQKRAYLDNETNETKHYLRFINLSNEEQLDAIFTMLQFMYDFFTNKDHDTNLINLSSNWFTRI